MIQTITTFAEQFGIIIPVIIGLVHVARKTGLSTRFAPLLSIVLGIVAGYFYISQDTMGVLFGIVAGLSSVTLTSSLKTTSLQ